MGYPGDQGTPDGRMPWPPQSPYGEDDGSFPQGPYDHEPGGERPRPDFGYDRPYEQLHDRPYGPAGGMRPEPGFGGGPDDPDDPYDTEPPRRRRRLPLIIGAAAVALAVLVGGGVALSSMLDDGSGEQAAPEASPPAPTTTPPTPTPSVTLSPVQLQNRRTDPEPLTLKEAFGNREFEIDGHEYTRTGWDSEKKCNGAVGGAKLEAALKKGDCTQALRATFAIDSEVLIGTLGVLNLKTKTHAEAAEKAAQSDDAHLTALPGKGVTKTNGRGVALGTAQARGHYLVMTWVQRPNGKKIAKRHHDTVRVFGSEIYKGSNLALALNYRETEGKPLQK